MFSIGKNGILNPLEIWFILQSFWLLEMLWNFIFSMLAVTFTTYSNNVIQFCINNGLNLFCSLFLISDLEK